MRSSLDSWEDNMKLLVVICLHARKLRRVLENLIRRERQEIMSWLVLIGQFVGNLRESERSFLFERLFGNVNTIFSCKFKSVEESLGDLLFL